MSCDFGVWFPHKKISDQEALKVYTNLCEGVKVDLQENPAVDAFYKEITLKHPEIDDVPDDKIDDHDYCPWSIAFDRSPTHLLISSVWSKAPYAEQLIKELAKKHGLAVFDPQKTQITYPDTKKLSWGLKRKHKIWLLFVWLLVAAWWLFGSSKPGPLKKLAKDIDGAVIQVDKSGQSQTVEFTSDDNVIILLSPPYEDLRDVKNQLSKEVLDQVVSKLDIETGHIFYIQDGQVKDHRLLIGSAEPILGISKSRHTTFLISKKETSARPVRIEIQ